jgi:hypothetical protein
MNEPISNLELQRAFPYLALGAVAIYAYLVKIDRDGSYDEFLKKSPGIAINTKGIEFGKGSGHDAGDGC